MLSKAASFVVLALMPVTVPHCGEPPRPPPTIPRPPRPPKPPKLPPIGGAEAGAARTIERQAESDDESLRIGCFAYDQFYDPKTNSLVLPSSDEFAAEVAEEILPDSPRGQAEQKAEDVAQLLEDLDSGDVAEVGVDLGCLG